MTYLKLVRSPAHLATSRDKLRASITRDQGDLIIKIAKRDGEQRQGCERVYFNKYAVRGEGGWGTTWKPLQPEEGQLSQYKRDYGYPGRYFATEAEAIQFTLDMMLNDRRQLGMYIPR